MAAKCDNCAYLDGLQQPLCPILIDCGQLFCVLSLYLTPPTVIERVIVFVCVCVCVSVKKISQKRMYIFKPYYVHMLRSTHG